MCSLWKFYLTLSVIILFATNVKSKIINDTCKFQNGKTGICVPFNNCKGAAEAIKLNELPQTCRFEGLNPIICCETELSLRLLAPGTKSLQKCNERYQRLSVRIGKGFNRINIAGGKDSLKQEFPHMALLGYGEENDTVWACGGSLISEKFVLTAAHCLRNRDLGEVKFIRLGDLNIKTNTDVADPQNFKIARMFRHPEFKPPSQYHDIALLELEKSARFTNFVKPACLHTTKDISDDTWIATGWGDLEFGGTPADHLQKVNLRHVNFENCKLFYNNVNGQRLKNRIVDEFQICAGENKKDTCQGDSGGPLQITKRGIFETYYVVIGVTSFGKACALTKSPGIYTRVSYYIPWIESIVWSN